MDDLQFTDDEIKSQLEALGYFNVSQERISQFKTDLHRLIESDHSTSSQSWTMGSSATDLDNSSFLNLPDPKPLRNDKMLSQFQPHLKKTNTEEAKPSNYYQNKISTNQMPSFDYYKSLRKNDGKIGNENQLDSSYVPATDDAYLDTTNDSLPLKNSLKKKGYLIEKLNENNSDVTQEFSDTSSNYDRKVLQKRKVARKMKDGTSQVYDESLIQDGEGTSGTIYRCHDLSSADDSVLSLRRNRKPSLPTRPQTARPHSGMRRASDSSSHYTSQLPSYIRPDVYPKTNNVKKEDPVNKFNKYQRLWANTKIPFDGNHKELRWQIKAQMLYREEPTPKPQRVYIPNTYVVPTSKKRSALRWEVRHALARGIEPETGPFELY